jgi:hypothetical protein
MLQLAESTQRSQACSQDVTRCLIWINVDSREIRAIYDLR